MMKWKAKKETTNIGILELGNLTFDEDYMEVYIDICGMSDGLKAEIAKAIEVAKVEDVRKWGEFYKEYPDCTPHERKWSDKPVVVLCNYLRIVLEEGKPNRYSIETAFEDAENDRLEACASTAVDLSEYENELKKAIIKVLVDKFFS